MAKSILERFGIKEVADCTFYEINNDGSPGKPVLFLDTLKVSTIEQTAETVYATGGKGNARLIGWDFGKEITLSLEDAVFSPKSMSIMFGDGTVKTDMTSIRKTLLVTVTSSGLPTTWTDPNGTIRVIPAKATSENDTDGKTIVTDEVGNFVAGSPTEGERVFMTFDVPIVGQVIEVNANSYPGTYYITGDTYARSEVTGRDEFFQFIVKKGKVTSENTITLEVEGDPSVFNMTVDVLRDSTGNMIELVKYSLDLEDTMGVLTVSSTEGSSMGYTKISVTPPLSMGHGYVYETGVSLDELDFDEDVSDMTPWNGISEIEATDGQDIVIVEMDIDGKAKKAGKAVVSSAG